MKKHATWIAPLTLALALCLSLATAASADPIPAAPAQAPAICAPELALASLEQVPVPADLFLPEPLDMGGCEPSCPFTPRCTSNSQCADYGGTCNMVCPRAGCCAGV
jgi:hypothetical protein